MNIYADNVEDLVQSMIANETDYEKLSISPHSLDAMASSFIMYGTDRNYSLFCSTSMEEFPIIRRSEPIVEWRCEGCQSVNLMEHRKCEECGAPRHFLRGDAQ